MSRLHLALAAAALAVTTLIAAETSAASIALKSVVTRVDRPVAVTHAGDGSGRLFVTLLAGKILVHDPASGGLQKTPFIDLGPTGRGLVNSSCQDCGLLNVAFDPDYAGNGYFYVFYTNAPGDIVIERYKVSAGNPNVADATSGSPILTVLHQPYEGHYGGQLQFGPSDGYLYISTGDGSHDPNCDESVALCGDPFDNAQNPARLLGKVLRIDVHPLDMSLYTIPDTNPFFAGNQPCGPVDQQTPAREAACPEVWALGLRNPWRFSFDRGDASGLGRGDLYIGDVGHEKWEEIDFQPAAAPGGANYGWRRLEGPACYNPPAGDPGCSPNDPTLTPPTHYYDHTQGDCSITAGYRYRGTGVPQLAGKYVFGDLCSGRIWELTATTKGDGSLASALLLDTGYTIVSLGEDEAGELYLVHYGTRGAVYRFASRGR